MRVRNGEDTGSAGALASASDTTNLEPSAAGPEVFLGGSCNPTTWRADVAIPTLDQLGISFYNPVCKREQRNTHAVRRIINQLIMFSFSLSFVSPGAASIALDTRSDRARASGQGEGEGTVFCARLPDPFHGRGDRGGAHRRSELEIFIGCFAAVLQQTENSQRNPLRRVRSSSFASSFVLLAHAH